MSRGGKKHKKNRHKAKKHHNHAAKVPAKKSREIDSALKDAALDDAYTFEALPFVQSTAPSAVALLVSDSDCRDCC